MGAPMDDSCNALRISQDKAVPLHKSKRRSKILAKQFDASKKKRCTIVRKNGKKKWSIRGSNP